MWHVQSVGAKEMQKVGPSGVKCFAGRSTVVCCALWFVDCRRQLPTHCGSNSSSSNNPKVDAPLRVMSGFEPVLVRSSPLFGEPHTINKEARKRPKEQA